MAEYMRESGLMTSDMAEVMSDSSMAISTRVSSNKEKHLVKVCSPGHMVKSMMENGSTESRKDMEFGGVRMGTHI